MTLLIAAAVAALLIAGVVFELGYTYAIVRSSPQFNILVDIARDCATQHGTPPRLTLVEDERAAEDRAIAVAKSWRRP